MWGQENYVTGKGLNTVKQHLFGDFADEFNDAIKFFIIKCQRSKNTYRAEKYYEAKYEYGRLSYLKNILEKKGRIK